MELLYGIIVGICSVGSLTLTEKKRCITAHVECAKRNKIPWTKEPTPQQMAKFHNKCVKRS